MRFIHTLLPLGTLLGAALIVTAGGCSKHEESVPAGPLYPTEASFCAARAQAVCNASVVGACYGSTPDSLAANTDSCIAKNTETAQCNPKSLTYHPTGGEGCVGAYQAIFADAKLDATELEGVAAACLAAFNEARPAGAVCASDDDCDAGDGLTCVPKAYDTSAATCQRAVSVGNGDDCAAPETLCPDEYYCVEVDATTHVCVERPDPTEQCSTTKPCKDTGVCNLTALVCDAKLPNGTDCVASDQCEGGFCSAVGKCSGVIVLAPTEPYCEQFLP